MTIHCMEDLSNELFFDIFDYLDGCDVINAFFYLNVRFRHLILTLPLLFKIKLCPEEKSNVNGTRKQVIVPYKHRILSLYLADSLIINRFFTIYPISSAFERLESLNLQLIRKDQLVLLETLSILTRLFRLIIHFTDDTMDLSDIYGFIGNLPVLEYNKISILFAKFVSFSSNIIKKQSTSIKQLVIDYNCTTEDLSHTLAHTPQLHRLYLKKTLNSSQHIVSSPTLSNLTHLHINKCDMHFDQFKLLIEEISSQLQVLKLFTLDHSSYLDANHWEQIISHHMTKLQKFYFQHRESSDNNHQPKPHHQLINQFTSSFWTDRQWIFDITINNLDFIYSIQPYRKQWFESDQFNNQTEIQRTEINSSIQFDKNVQLTITHRFTHACLRLLTNKINSISTIVKITCLDIDCTSEIRNLIQPKSDLRVPPGFQLNSVSRDTNSIVSYNAFSNHLYDTYCTCNLAAKGGKGPYKCQRGTDQKCPDDKDGRVIVTHGLYILLCQPQSK
ncbi:unnamed protein product [Adineta ricciae]|uniref:F-box domain-containing protein n=1 Tax=Adineta ricciae TaxID=249248 RepID=A0A815V0V8_ADIRI|nr:unnamed protein product [Adineta ricciae]CAF1528297.1 unnamed protein product [Adineta ricciae]